MKYLDIDILKMTQGDLQSNLSQIEIKYGNKFICKSSSLDLEIPIKFYKEKIQSTNIQFYTLIYDITDRIFDMFPLKIDFIDPETKKLNSNVYI